MSETLIGYTDTLMAVCSTCKKIKTKENTSTANDRPDKFCTYCKECLKNRRAVQKAKELRSRKQKDYYERVKEKLKEQNLKSRFGITAEDYQTMLTTQGNKCAICKRDKDTFSKSMAVDHCHTSGKNRGLLCTNCNTGLGQFRDSIEILENAINYLKEHKDGN